MSGKRQHFIPRFLLRGFLDARHIDKELVHVYGRTSAPFGTDIKNIGAEGHFYGKPGAESLDERITSTEGRLSQYLDELREYSNSQAADNDKCAALCAHLAIRTRHLRLAVHQILDSFVAKVAVRYREPGGREAVVRKLFEGDQKELKNAIRNEIAKHNTLRQLSPAQQDALIEHLLSRPDEIIAVMVRGMEGPIPEILDALRRQMKVTVEGAHNKSLHSDAVTSEHERKLRELSWSVVDVGHDLILGDFVLLAQQDLTPTYTSYLLATKLPVVLFLPISTSRLLVGSQGTINGGLDIESLNRQIASNSIEYFVASSMSNQNIELSRLIGTGVQRMMTVYEQMIDELIRTQMILQP